MFDTISKSITTLVVAVGALLNTNLSPVFHEVKLDYTNDKFICSAKLDDCFNEDLDKILSSGQEVKVDYVLQVLTEEKEVIAQKNFYHEMSYDLIDGRFIIFLSEKEKYKFYESLEEVKSVFTTLESIIVTEKLPDLKNGFFYFKIVATLRPIYMESIEKHFDLIKYWNNKPAKYLSHKLRLKEITR